jgi:hypothetical protein
MTVAGLLAGVVERTPLRQTSQGYAGATLERVILVDGRALVVKRISPAWDVAMRLTHDTGRAAWLWTSGVMARFPPVGDHAVVAAEPDGDGWVIVMRDVAAALLPDARILTRAESRRILAAAALHAALAALPSTDSTTSTPSAWRRTATSATTSRRSSARAASTIRSGASARRSTTSTASACRS